MKLPILKTFAVADLITLRDEISGLISKRIGKERAELERQLTAINGTAHTNVPRKGTRAHSLKGKKVPPKYRNPKDRTQTWAGRGATPRWIQSAVKQGGKLDDFLIEKAA